MCTTLKMHAWYQVTSFYKRSYTKNLARITVIENYENVSIEVNMTSIQRTLGS